MSGAPVDLPGLLAALDPRATRPERNAWLVRLMRWLVAGTDTESPAQRLNLLIDALDHSDASRRRVQLLLANFWRQTDLASLFADFGFTGRRDLWGEIGERLAQRWLPATPDTDDMATLFRLMFESGADADWLAELDASTLARLSNTLALNLSIPAADDNEAIVRTRGALADYRRTENATSIDGLKAWDEP